MANTYVAGTVLSNRYTNLHKTPYKPGDNSKIAPNVQNFMIFKALLLPSSHLILIISCFSCYFLFYFFYQL